MVGDLGGGQVCMFCGKRNDTSRGADCYGLLRNNGAASLHRPPGPRLINVPRIRPTNLDMGNQCRLCVGPTPSALGQHSAAPAQLLCGIPTSPLLREEWQQEPVELKEKIP